MGTRCWSNNVDATNYMSFKLSLTRVHIVDGLPKNILASCSIILDSFIGFFSILIEVQKKLLFDSNMFCLL